MDCRGKASQLMLIRYIDDGVKGTTYVCYIHLQIMKAFQNTPHSHQLNRCVVIPPNLNLISCYGNIDRYIMLTR